MSYVDGFVLLVPKKNTAAYTKMAKEAGKSWMKHGAVAYFECKADDLKVPDMGGEKAWSFPDMTKQKPGEAVWYSFIIYKSKAHRNQVLKKVMKEMNDYMEKHGPMKMPFDLKRMAMASFQPMVEYMGKGK